MPTGGQLKLIGHYTKPPYEIVLRLFDYAKTLRTSLSILYQMKTQKKITGDTLIGMGFRPGKWFGAAIEHANATGLRGPELKTYLDGGAPQIIDPHPAPLPYHQNLHAETEDEIANVESVQQTMQKLMTVPTVVKGAVMPDACPAGP